METIYLKQNGAATLNKTKIKLGDFDIRIQNDQIYLNDIDAGGYVFHYPCLQFFVEREILQCTGKEYINYNYK